MTVRLTETAIAKAVREVSEAGARRDLADAACPGLRLRLTAAGGKSWVLACRDREGRMRRFPLGGFPTLGISEARDAARALHVQVKQNGADPVAAAKRDRSIGRDAKAGIGTLAALLELYGEQHGKKQKSWVASRAQIECVFAAHLSRPLATMKVGDLQMTADGWRSQHSASAAVRYLRPILKWAAQRSYVGSGMTAIYTPTTTTRRARVLSQNELAALLPA